MAKISKRFGSGGANLAPGGSAGRPALADVLRDVADDLAAFKPAVVVAADATATYGAGEQGYFLALAQDRAGTPDIESSFLDLTENSKSAPREQLDVGLDVS